MTNPSRTPSPTHWVAQQMGEPQLGAPASILDLLNYQLHVLLSFSTAGVTRLCEQEFGITRHEWGYIGLLAAFGPMAPSDLALRSGMDRSRTSKALMPLLTKQLVSRKSVVGDRRFANVALTATGWRLYERMFPRVLEIHNALLAPLAPEEVQVLARVVNKLRPQAVALSTAAALPARRLRGAVTARSWQPPGVTPDAAELGSPSDLGVGPDTA